MVNGDDPILIKWLAFIWRREEDDLGAEIEDLVKCQLLGKDGDFIFDPMMIQCGPKDDEKEGQSSQNQELSNGREKGKSLGDGKSKVPKSRKTKVPTEEDRRVKNSKDSLYKDKESDKASIWNNTDHSSSLSADARSDSDPNTGTRDPSSASIEADSDKEKSINPSASTSVPPRIQKR